MYVSPHISIMYLKNSKKHCRPVSAAMNEKPSSMFALFLLDSIWRQLSIFTYVSLPGRLQLILTVSHTFAQSRLDIKTFKSISKEMFLSLHGIWCLHVPKIHCVRLFFFFRPQRSTTESLIMKPVQITDWMLQCLWISNHFACFQQWKQFNFNWN